MRKRCGKSVCVIVYVLTKAKLKAINCCIKTRIYCLSFANNDPVLNGFSPLSFPWEHNLVAVVIINVRLFYYFTEFTVCVAKWRTILVCAWAHIFHVDILIMPVWSLNIAYKYRDSDNGTSCVQCHCIYVHMYQFSADKWKVGIVYPCVNNERRKKRITEPRLLVCDKCWYSWLIRLPRCTENIFNGLTIATTVAVYHYRYYVCLKFGIFHHRCR